MTDEKRQTEVRKEDSQPENKQTKEVDQTQEGVWEKVGDVAEKSFDALKSGAEKAGRFTKRATTISKLKLDIHNLKNKMEGIYSEMGKKLWHMKKSNESGEIRTAFNEEFEKLADLEKEIAAKQRHVRDIHLLEEQKPE